MPDANAQQMLETACRLAREAATRSLANLGRAAVDRKPDGSLVTETDYEIQQLILDEIAREYPQHAVIAEEVLDQPDRHADRTTARYCWVVDPLDGTRNYAATFPCFATSIAVLDRGTPLVGVVLEHVTGRIHTAIRGEGAAMGGDAIRVREPDPERDWIVGIESSKHPDSLRVLQDWLARPGIICRNLGSAAYHLALVATGALDASFCRKCAIWDIAAGCVLITEAGGTVINPFGGVRVPFNLADDPSALTPILAGRAFGFWRMKRRSILRDFASASRVTVQV